MWIVTKTLAAGWLNRVEGDLGLSCEGDRIDYFLYPKLHGEGMWKQQNFYCYTGNSKFPLNEGHKWINLHHIPRHTSMAHFPVQGKKTVSRIYVLGAVQTQANSRVEKPFSFSFVFDSISKFLSLSLCMRPLTFFLYSYIWAHVGGRHGKLSFWTG